MGGTLMTHSESDKILYHGDVSDNMNSLYYYMILGPTFIVQLHLGGHHKKPTLCLLQITTFIGITTFE